jgi:hypothetical protein
VLGWASVDQVMVRNLIAQPTVLHEGLDIDGFTAIHCDDILRDDQIALRTSGLRDTQATCWNTTNNDLVLANKDSDGKHACANLYTEPGDIISLTVSGTSAVIQ